MVICLKKKVPLPHTVLPYTSFKNIFIWREKGCSLFMTKYIFMLQLDVDSSQLLVTDNDFRNPDFRKQLSQTVNSLLDLKVIPIFNENDAISTRRAPYEVFIFPLYF